MYESMVILDRNHNKIRFTKYLLGLQKEKIVIPWRALKPKKKIEAVTTRSLNIYGYFQKQEYVCFFLFSI
jgi:hypothetical protein